MKKILDGNYPPLPNSLSPEMVSIVNSMLSADPKNRPTTEEILKKFNNLR